MYVISIIFEHNLTVVVEFAHIFEIIHGCFTSSSTVIDMKTATKQGHSFVKSSKLGLCHVLCYWLEPRINLLIFIRNFHLTTNQFSQLSIHQFFSQAERRNAHGTVLKLNRDEPNHVKEINVNYCINSINKISIRAQLNF